MLFRTSASRQKRPFHNRSCRDSRRRRPTGPLIAAAIAYDEGLSETILEIEVRGKRGVGYCKIMPGAVLPFRRLLKRKRTITSTDESARETTTEVTPGPTDLLFPKRHSEIFDAVLEELSLKKDRDEQARTAYTLADRHLSTFVH